MTEATATATDDPARLAATLEADTLQRAGHITYTQARARIRDRLASPVAHLDPRGCWNVRCQLAGACVRDA